MEPDKIRDMLVERLRERLSDNGDYWDLYRNRQVPPQTHSRYSSVYKLLLDMAPNPLGRLVVDTVAERLSVQGVRLTAPQADEAAWQVWQDNRLDERQQLVYRDAGVTGAGFVSVWPGSDGPVITPEDTNLVEVDFAPGTLREVRYALKMWFDYTDKKAYATLYTDEALYKYEAPLSSDGKLPQTSIRWQRREVPGESWPLRNPVGRVPFVPFLSRSTLSGGGESELAPLKGIIKRTDKLTLDMLLASETSAFAQRYIIGAEIPRDEAGNPLPMNWALDKVVAIEDENASIGQLQPAPLDNYLKAIDAQMAMLTSISRIPAHYLYTASLANPPSADSLVAGEAGLVFKVEERQRSFGEAWEDVLRLALPLTGEEYDEQALRRMEMVWAPADRPSPTQLADLAIKAAQVGVPQEGVWAMLGASPEEVRRWRTMQIQDTMNDLMQQGVGLEDTRSDEKEAVDVLKAKAEAMRTMIDAGVEPEGAARAVGLSGLTFEEPQPVPAALAAANEVAEDEAEEEPDAG